MTYHKTMEKLSNMRFTKPDKVLSLYLHTDRSHPDQQGGEWKIALKNGFNRLEEYIEASSMEELKRLRSIRENVEKYVEGMERKMPRGLIIFASADSGLWETFELQVSVPTNFYWEEYPVLDELQKMYQAYPLTGFVLMQQNEIKILTSIFALLEESESMEFDLEIDDWRMHQGPSHHSSSMGSGAIKTASQVDHYEDRINANQKRWVKSLGSKLDKKAADKQWEKIILVGDKGEAELLEGYMNKKVDAIIQKNLLNENENTVLEKLLA
ncbi:VLRF1 family aeRF1-type release factor [Sutcliffiella horikoshii]|uniref:VLRF1 family aeRF1-type release factor n=1 Tax=Sutcliffiella horikoshii TaxID=79883 RepID=UPI001CC12FDE|nr:VLRF1 family aeRF1-type release factor [Sutcliffiella horikoshii]